MKKIPQKIQQMPLAVTWFWTQYAHILPESNQIYQNSPDFSISLLSSRGRSSTNTCSISKILYVLKSYGPNSFISDTFDAIPPRRRTKNHRWSWVNLGKIHLHHPTYGEDCVPAGICLCATVSKIQTNEKT